MVAAESITATLVYTYNGDGLLLAERHNGDALTFTWDQALALPQVLQTSGGLRALHGLQRLGVYQGDWYYPQADALGSLRQWTDAQGTALGLQGYGPYGEALVPIGPPLAPWGYTGEWEDASGLVYLRARWHNPVWGRFTQVDPVVGVLALPATRHPYAYGVNNPIRYTDPSGRFIDTLLDLAFIAYDIHEIQQKGLNWETGTALVLDVGSAALPEVTGGGALVHMASHADDAGDLWRAARAIDDVDDLLDLAKGLDRLDDLRDAGKAVNWLDDAVDTLNGVRDAAKPTNAAAERVLKGTCPPSDWHHSIPREVLRERDRLKAGLADLVRGKKGQPNRWLVPRAEHQQIHRQGYNKRFLGLIREQVRAGVDLTEDVVLVLRDQVAGEFGILRFKP